MTSDVTSGAVSRAVSRAAHRTCRLKTKTLKVSPSRADKPHCNGPRALSGRTMPRKIKEYTTSLIKCLPFRARVRRLLAGGLLMAGMALAQISGGAFRGEVRDASNAVVPKAKIVIRSAENGMQAIAESNGEGLYVSPNLIPGSYRLSAVRTGFKTEVFGPVLLEVNQTVRIDFALEVGEVTESIEVKAAPEQLLAAESAEVSQVIGGKQVAEIPLNGRSWQQLITLSAGVNPGAPGESGSPNPVNVDGQRTKGNLFMVDGISVTSSAQGRGNDFNIPLDAVQEFSVQAGAYSAEYGDVAGGVINLQSKSGTNNWHGSLFEFFRNDATDAANFFSNATGQPKNPLQYNQFGGSAGGPVRRNKTFVFADYQGTVVHSSTPMVSSVPLNAQRTGDFSGLSPVPIYNPFGASYARTPFPNNMIPQSLIDPAAEKISALLPQPNQFGAGGLPLAFNNYAVTRASTEDLNSFDIRVDHQFSASNTAFARYSFQNTNAVVPSLFGPPLGGTLEGAGTTLARNQNTAIGDVHQFGPTLLNEIRIGVNRQNLSLNQAGCRTEPFGSIRYSGREYESPNLRAFDALCRGALQRWRRSSDAASACHHGRELQRKSQLGARAAGGAGRIRLSVRDGQHGLSGLRPRLLHISESDHQQPGGNAGRQRFCQLPDGRALSGSARRVSARYGGAHLASLRVLRAGRYQADAEADRQHRRALRRHALPA